MSIRSTLSLALLLLSLVTGLATTSQSNNGSVAADWVRLGDLPLTLSRVQAEEFVLTSREELESQIGHRLNLSERFVFNYAKRKLRRALRKGTSLEVPPVSSSGMWVGIVLVLALGLIGLLIALIVGNRNMAGIVQGAWLAMGVIFAISLFLLSLLVLAFA